MNSNDFETHIIDEYRKMHDWPKWKESIMVELVSLTKCELFWSMVETLKDVQSVGQK